MNNHGDNYADAAPGEEHKQIKHLSLKSSPVDDAGKVHGTHLH
jgi:hypothetical protein